MAGAPPRYSEEQREAFIAAVIDGGKSAAAVLELAKSGRLAGLPAFHPSYDQVTEWVRIRKRDILATTPPAPDDYNAISRRLWAQHVAEIDRLERELKKKKRTDVEKERLARQLSEAIKRHRDARALLASTPAKDGEPTPGPKTEPKTLFDRLATETAQGEREAKTETTGQTDSQNAKRTEETEDASNHHDLEQHHSKSETEDGDRDVSAPADAPARAIPRGLAAVLEPDLHTESVEPASLA